MDDVIEIDPHELCVFPRRSPETRAKDALEQIGFEMVSLSDAVNAGAMLSERSKQDLDGMIRYLGRIKERVS